MDTDFIVYAHLTPDTMQVFYIGEGRPSRAYSKRHRNRFWKNVVHRHGGFLVHVIKDSITKRFAERMERRLIKLARSRGLRITNICDGVLFGDTHWLVGKDKSLHPMFGKKRPDSSKRMSERNKLLVGEASPVYGLKRPDLSERNKLGKFKRKCRRVLCEETGRVYDSIKSAKSSMGGNPNIIRAIKTNGTAHGYHWSYVD